MRTDPCRAWREQLGALALGGLDEDERGALQAHVDGCERCRREAAELRRVAAALPAADPDRVPAPRTIPERVAERLFADIGAQRGRRRRGLALRVSAAMAAAGAAAVLAVALIGPGSEPAPRPARAQPVIFRSLPHGASIRATVAGRSWGTRIQLRIRGFRLGTPCTVYLRRADGTRVPAGSFRYAYGAEEAGVTLAAALPRPQAAALEVRAGTRTFIADLT